jgi:two-component sensor histidine kinase
VTQSTVKAALSVSMSPFPDARLVTALSRLVSEYCRMVLEDADAASRFHMAAHELVENVAKYSTGSRMRLEVELGEAGGSHVMRVRVCNETSAQQLREVEKRLTELAAAENPVKLYDRLIRETAPISDVSGLGLARIRAEAELELDYRVEGNELTISVQGPVLPREVK